MNVDLFLVEAHTRDYKFVRHDIPAYLSNRTPVRSVQVKNIVIPNSGDFSFEISTDTALSMFNYGRILETDRTFYFFIEPEPVTPNTLLLRCHIDAFAMYEREIAIGGTVTSIMDEFHKGIRNFPQREIVNPTETIFKSATKAALFAVVSASDLNWFGTGVKQQFICKISDDLFIGTSGGLSDATNILNNLSNATVLHIGNDDFLIGAISDIVLVPTVYGATNTGLWDSSATSDDMLYSTAGTIAYANGTLDCRVFNCGSPDGGAIVKKFGLAIPQNTPKKRYFLRGLATRIDLGDSAELYRNVTFRRAITGNKVSIFLDTAETTIDVTHSFSVPNGFNTLNAAIQSAKFADTMSIVGSVAGLAGSVAGVAATGGVSGALGVLGSVGNVAGAIGNKITKKATVEISSPSETWTGIREFGGLALCYYTTPDTEEYFNFLYWNGYDSRYFLPYTRLYDLPNFSDMVYQQKRVFYKITGAHTTRFASIAYEPYIRASSIPYDALTEIAAAFNDGVNIYAPSGGNYVSDIYEDYNETINRWRNE